MSKLLRTGITTGTCAAAATKSAAWTALGTDHLPQLFVMSPQGQQIAVTIAGNEKTPAGGKAWVKKDSGDDPDITNQTLIFSEVVITDSPEIIIAAGEGVGTVTKPGLSVAVGQPAINPGPRQMILQALNDVLPPGKGAIVTLSIPDGAALAKRTLNPMLGIVGGLSIIGTTGIVEPMSEEAFKKSLAPQISVVKALGHASIVFTPGKIGQDIAINRYDLPSNQIVQTSNFVGYMLESAVQYGMQEVLIFGHLGKLVKLAAGIFHTHNRMADGRMETLAAYLALNGASRQIINEIMNCTTTEAAMPIISANNLTKVYADLAERASIRAMRYVFDDLNVGTVIVTLRGDILGMDKKAREIGGKLGWNIK